MRTDGKIFLAGHRGLVGTAVEKRLRLRGYDNLLLQSHRELDLTRQSAVETFFDKERPACVIIAAAKVGGIYANETYPADFIYDNLMIATNVIHAAYRYGVKKLINLGSSCIYPKLAPQPLKEEYLLSGPLESTNEAYAVAKIAAIKLCHYYNKQYGTRFISLMPTNLYGPNDNYHPKNSHVIPALIGKIHEAKINRRDTVELWGDGSPLREFLYSDDLGDAIVFVMENANAFESFELINVGTGEEISIKNLARLIADEISYPGEIVWNSEMPNGTPRKILDSSRIISLGWAPATGLRHGIKAAYRDFLKRHEGNAKK